MFWFVVLFRPARWMKWYASRGNHGAFLLRLRFLRIIFTHEAKGRVELSQFFPYAVFMGLRSSWGRVHLLTIASGVWTVTLVAGQPRSRMARRSAMQLFAMVLLSWSCRRGLIFTSINLILGFHWLATQLTFALKGLANTAIWALF